MDGVRLSLLLRPGWLGISAAVLLFAVASFTMLAPWQFERHEDRAQRNDAVKRAMESQPQPLDEAFGSATAPDSASEWTPVTVTGRYLPDDEFIARLRTVHGEPAFEILTPLRTTDGQVVLIDRGYLSPDDDAGVGEYDPPPSGQVTVTARAQVDEHSGAGASDVVGETRRGLPQVNTISSDVASDVTGHDVRPGYFALAPEQPGVLSALPLPRTNAGPYFAYALQWIAFGVMALGAWVYFTVRELRPGGALHQRRKRSVAQILADDEAAEAAGPTGDEDDGRSGAQRRDAGNVDQHRDRDATAHTPSGN